MIQKVLSFAFLIIAVAAGTPAVKKQFPRLDSSLARLAALPEVRMKEIAPFDGVAKRMLASHPEILAVLRTNSRGTVVNRVGRVEDGRGDAGVSPLHDDVSGQPWYAAAKQGTGPYYGPLHKENGRATCIWSRPLSITMPDGGSRFGGTVAVLLDSPQRPQADTGTFSGQKEAAAPAPAPDKRKSPSVNETRAIGPQAVPDTVPDAVSGRTRGGKTPFFLKIAVVAVVVLVLLCLWLIFSTLFRRRPARPFSGDAVSGTAAAPGEIDGSDGPDRVDVPAFLLTPPVPAPEAAPVTTPAPSAPEASPEKSAVVPEEIRDAAAQQVRDEGIRAEMRAKITDEQRNDIYREELVNTTAAIRRQIIDNEMTGLISTLRKQFAAEMRQNIVETMSASIEEQERAAVAKEAAEKIRTVEYDAIVRAEREKLAQSVRTALAEEESARLTAEAREKLRDEIARAFRENEEETVRAAVRGEMTEEIRRELLEGEKDLIAEEQTRKVETELYDEVSREQGDAIRASVIDRITEEEHRRVEEGLRETIVEDEKKRIIAEESDGLRAGITAQIRAEEIDSLRRSVRDEIFAETVQAIKQNLDGKYQAAVEEKLADIRTALQKKIRADIGASIKADYERLMERTDRLSTFLTDIEPLQSLSQTVALLSDEKKKFKYLNLNTAQTESLLEYLRRVHNRLNIFFDKVDESVRQLMLDLGSVKNKLDNND